MFRSIKQRLADMSTIRMLCLEAEALARKDGQPEPGAEHFLLAALRLPDGTARRAFIRAGADPDGLEAAIAEQYADALRMIGVDLSSVPEPAAPDMPVDAPGLYRAAPSGQHVMQQLAAARKASGRGPLTGAHVVSVVAAMAHGVPARALRAMGVDREALRLAAAMEFNTLAETGR